jgi:hypothetical protein
MKKDRAYQYHDRTLQHLRGRKASLRAAASESTVSPDVTIAVAVEEIDGEARVGLRVTSYDEATRAAVDELKSNGDIPEDVEVHEVGRLFGFSAADLVSPLQAGVSCANITGARGTLACFVKRNGTTFLLSANHVLAVENTAAPNSDILQPSAGAVPQQKIGELSAFEPLMPDGNVMDGAIAELAFADADIDFRLFNGKRITEVRTAPLTKGVRVLKFGQASDERAGRIRATVTSNVKLEMDFGQYTFDQQIEIVPDVDGVPFAIGGDSGSLVYDEQDRAVGLVIGGNGVDLTYVTPIGVLLQHFQIELA